MIAFVSRLLNPILSISSPVAVPKLPMASMILSVPEGHDKPLKYPLIFQVCDALIINKIDVLPYFDFDMEKVVQYAKMRNPNLKIFPISAKTGEGVDAWCDWLRKNAAQWNNG